jgi:hypothetical protein
MDRLQPFDGDVCVELRGGERSVTEQLLNAAEIGPTLKQVGGCGVAKAVRAHVGRSRHRANSVVHDPTHGPRIEPPAPGTQEQCPT